MQLSVQSRRDGSRSNWGRESYQIRTDQFGFGAIDSVLRFWDRHFNTESDFTGKMSNFFSSESEPTGADHLGFRLTLRYPLSGDRCHRTSDIEDQLNILPVTSDKTLLITFGIGVCAPHFKGSSQYTTVISTSTSV